MTKKEQIDGMAVIGCVRNPQAHTAEECAKCDFKQGQCNAYRHAKALYEAGYRKIMNGKELNSELDEEECDVVDDYTIGFATYLMQKRRDEVDRMQAEIKRLNTIVERLDELLGKGINDYIMGIDGVEGLKDMWERSAVRAFAEKLRKRLTEDRVSNDNVVINANYEIDELLKEYEK